MAYPRRGQHAWIGVGEESTYGTEVARSNFLEVARCSLRRIHNTKPTSRLGRTGQASNMPREFVVVNDLVEGSIAWPLAYDDSSILMLKHLLGANTTTGSGPYVHALTLASPSPIGLSLEYSPGPGPFDAAEQITGINFSRGTITITPGEEIMCEVECIGRTHAGFEAPGTPTFSSNGERIFQHQLTAGYTLGGTTIELMSATITLDRNIDRLMELGTLFTQKPVERGQLSVTIDLTAAWQRSDFHTKHYADTQGDFTATFTSGSKSLVLTAHNCIVEDVSNPVESAGMIEQRVRLRAYADSSVSGDQGLSLAFTNGNSSHSAN